MELAIEALADEARRVGEAFLTVRASQDRRLGLAARQENGTISLDLEVQVRVLPSRSDVSIAALKARIDDLSELEAIGFGLFHFEDGWVLATRSISPRELDRAVERVLGLFAEQDR